MERKDTIACNRCWESITDTKAVLTPCSHIYCVPCASEWFATHSECPACDRGINRDAELYSVFTQPTPRHERILMGLNPTAILALASAAVAFWNYQKNVRLDYANHLLAQAEGSAANQEEIRRLRAELTETRATLQSYKYRLSNAESEFARAKQILSDLEAENCEQQRKLIRFEEAFGGRRSGSTLGARELNSSSLHSPNITLTPRPSSSGSQANRISTPSAVQRVQFLRKPNSGVSSLSTVMSPRPSDSHYTNGHSSLGVPTSPNVLVPLLPESLEVTHDGHTNLSAQNSSVTHYSQSLVMSPNSEAQSFEDSNGLGSKRAYSRLGHASPQTSQHASLVGTSQSQQLRSRIGDSVTGQPHGGAGGGSSSRGINGLNENQANNHEPSVFSSNDNNGSAPAAKASGSFNKSSFGQPMTPRGRSIFSSAPSSGHRSLSLKSRFSNALVPSGSENR